MFDRSKNIHEVKYINFSEFEVGKWYYSSYWSSSPRTHIAAKFKEIRQQKNGNFYFIFTENLVKEIGSNTILWQCHDVDSWKWRHKGEYQEIPLDIIAKHLPLGHADRIANDKSTIQKAHTRYVKQTQSPNPCDEIILTGAPTTDLPPLKWFISCNEIKSNDKDKKFIPWLNKYKTNDGYYSSDYLIDNIKPYICYPDLGANHFYYAVNSLINSGYQQITFKQFKKWFLNEVKSEIGNIRVNTDPIDRVMKKCYIYIRDFVSDEKIRSLVFKKFSEQGDNRNALQLNDYFVIDETATFPFYTYSDYNNLIVNGFRRLTLNEFEEYLLNTDNNGNKHKNTTIKVCTKGAEVRLGQRSRGTTVQIGRPARAIKGRYKGNIPSCS